MIEKCIFYLSFLWKGFLTKKNPLDYIKQLATVNMQYKENYFSEKKIILKGSGNYRPLYFPLGNKKWIAKYTENPADFGIQHINVIFYAKRFMISVVE